MIEPDSRPLSILHVLRAPLGGLFRHVIDLAREQIARGHRVGLIADSLTGGAAAHETLESLAAGLALGLSRVPMRRSLHPSDALALAHVMARVRAAKPDIVHGHGSKGGAFARLAAGGSRQAVVAYTPHGGSFNYRPGEWAHAIYMTAERLLASRTDLFLFESAYIQRRFHESATRRRFRERIVLNGIAPQEFEPIRPGADAADFVYVGELRAAKGIDTMIDALSEAGAALGRAPTAVLVGSGPDQVRLTAQVRDRGLERYVRFPGRMPAREAFRMGRILVVPSRAESLPYVVLEAAGARLPMIATNVGGIPEIFGPHADRLIPCDDVSSLSRAMVEALASDARALDRHAASLAEFVASRFSITAMVDAAIAGYRESLLGRATTEPARIAPAPASS